MVYYLNYFINIIIGNILVSLRISILTMAGRYFQQAYDFTKNVYKDRLMLTQGELAGISYICIILPG
jgi:hypothetical protein